MTFSLAEGQAAKAGEEEDFFRFLVPIFYFPFFWWGVSGAVYFVCISCQVGQNL